MTQLFHSIQNPQIYPTRIGLTRIVWRASATLLLLIGLIGVASSSLITYGAPLRQNIPAGCTELIVNGDFETIGPEWELQSGTRPPMLVSDVTHNGSNNSMQLGIVNLSNVESDSFVKQTVGLPSGVSRITLTFYYYTRWSGTPDTEDIQYAEIFNNLTGTFLDRVLTEQSNTRGWNVKQRDLTPYAGQQVSLYFVVTNDGETNSVAMNIDDVSILACDPVAPATDTPTSTPPNTPTNTPTPTLDTTNPTPPTSTFTPTNAPPSTATSPPPVDTGRCQNYLINGDFEAGAIDFHNDAGWIRGKDPVQAQLTTDTPFSGAYSVVLGNPPNNGYKNVQTWSSIRQLVQLPANLTSAELRWRHRTFSEEGANANPTNSEDRMDVIFLQPDLIPIEIVDRHRSKPNTYQSKTVPINLAHYGGKHFFVYFNVYNDGASGRTWSKVDNIELVGCRGQAQPANPAATNTPSSTPTNTNTPQPGATNTPIPTNTPTTPNPDPPAGIPAPQETATKPKNTPDPKVESTEEEPLPEYSITPILPAEGLQEPTTLPTFETVNSRGILERLGLRGSDPDPQPTSSFQWLRTAVTCLLALVVLALVLYLARALIMRRGGN